MIGSSWAVGITRNEHHFLFRKFQRRKQKGGARNHVHESAPMENDVDALQKTRLVFRFAQHDRQTVPVDAQIVG